VSTAFREESFPPNPVRIISGAGAAAVALEQAQALGATRVVLVCGPTVRRSGAVERVTGATPTEVEVAVFDGVEPDPSDRTVTRGGAFAREAGAQALVALGGGSSLDAAKAIAAEACDPGWVGRQDRPGRPTEVTGGALSVLAIPMTAGTGSEVTPFSVITFMATDRKLVLNHPALYPRVALLDPGLLGSAAGGVRVAAGMDALTHAVEGYVSRQASDESRRFALAAIGEIGAHLRGACSDPPDPEALAGMQQAAMVAGLGFSTSRLGIVHAMALPLSALFHVPHGVANTILLPHGIAFNLEAAAEPFADIAAALGAPREPEQALQAVRQLAADIGAPTRMREVGVEPAAIPRMAQDALPSAHVKVNPRLIELADLIAVYEAAF